MHVDQFKKQRKREIIGWIGVGIYAAGGIVACFVLPFLTERTQQLVAIGVMLVWCLALYMNIRCPEDNLRAIYHRIYQFVRKP